MMSRKCLVPDCPAKLKEKCIQFFSFPKNPTTCEMWKKACCITDNFKIFNGNICSLHFDDTDYYIHDRINLPIEKRRLLTGAIPTLNLKSPTNENKNEILFCDVNDIEMSTVPKLVDISMCDPNQFEQLHNDDSTHSKVTLTKFYKDSSTQCNFFEELWEENVQKENIECDCVEKFFENIKSITKFEQENVENKKLELKDETISSNFHENDSIFEISDDNYDDNNNDNEIIDFDKIESFPISIPGEKKSRRKTKSIFIKNVDYLEIENGFECLKCNKRFLTIAAFYAHGNSHKEKSSVCTKCGFSFKDYKLLTHEKNCSKSTMFTEQNYLKSRTYRGGIANRTCNICNRSFQKKVSLLDHMNIHNNIKPYICSCNSKLTHYTTFLQHVRKYNCPIAGRIIPSYAPQGLTVQYAEIKEKGLIKPIKRFQCRVCDVCYARDKYMSHFTKDIHKNAEKLWRNKFNITKINCTNCNKIFETLYDCIRHRSKVHRRFPTDEYIKSLEEKIEHENTYLESLEQRKNLVSNMEQFKIISKHLNRQRTNHIKQEQKYCKQCDKYFVKRITFLDHQNIHKNAYPYICSCEYRQRCYQSFVTHIRQCKSKGVKIFPNYAPQTFANINDDFDTNSSNNEKEISAKD